MRQSRGIRDVSSPNTIERTHTIKCGHIGHKGEGRGEGSGGGEGLGGGKESNLTCKYIERLENHIYQISI